MVKKEFSFRGKTLVELQALSLEAYAKLLRSRERRSVLRGTDKALMKRIQKSLMEKGAGKEIKAVRTHKRDFVIKGNGFETVEIKPEMLGHRLGEFSLTRKRLTHGKAGIGATKSSTAITARG